MGCGERDRIRILIRRSALEELQTSHEEWKTAIEAEHNGVVVQLDPLKE